MKFSKVILLTILPLLFSFWLVNAVQGQQEPNFSQYMFYGLTFNPALAGNDNAVSITAADRIQWTSFGKEEGEQVAPRTYFVSADLPIRILKGGVGAVIMQDALGHEKTISVKIGYANQRNLGFGKLGIGTQIEFNNRSIDFSKLRPAGEDPLIGQLAKESEMLIDFSLGVFYRVPGSYYLGVSGLHLVQTKGKPLAELDQGGLRMKLDRTFFITGGYEITFPRNPDFQLIPSVIIESDLAKTRLDVNAMLRYKELVWGGVGYRLGESVIILLGVQYKDFRIGYSYDINVSKLALPFFGGSHEIMLNYRFKLELEKGRKSYKNTRFL
ncbi:MAG: type IX secretion system membrane protein PorP/SprF [Bacteroidales bacterium]|nr:type IX secretion system membrane protein PorP/SprF [Bacteroidales bacterium]